MGDSRLPGAGLELDVKIKTVSPPREFVVGLKKDIRIRHCANVDLAPDEMVTFVTPSGREYDVVRKSWGYYATPSMNGRLCEQGLRAVLTRNVAGRIYLLLVEAGCEPEFERYMADEEQEIVCWLDSDAAAQKLILLQNTRKSRKKKDRGRY